MQTSSSFTNIREWTRAFQIEYLALLQTMAIANNNRNSYSSSSSSRTNKQTSGFCPFVVCRVMRDQAEKRGAAKKLGVDPRLERRLEYKLCIFFRAISRKKTARVELLKEVTKKTVSDRTEAVAASRVEVPPPGGGGGGPIGSTGCGGQSRRRQAAWAAQRR